MRWAPAVATLALVALPATGTVASSRALAATETVAATDTVDWGDIDSSGLIDMGPIDPAIELTFLFGLRADRAGRAAFAIAANSPSDPAYGDHLTPAEAVDRFGATPSTYEAVLAVLAEAGHEARLDPTRTYVETTMTVAEAEALFSTTWRAYEFGETSFWEGVALAMPTGTPVLPPAMQGHVERVHGAVVYMPQEESGGSSASEAPTAGSVAAPVVAGGTPVATGTPSGCAAGAGIEFGGERYGLTPNQVLTAYGIDELHAMGLQGQGASVAIIDDSIYDPAWLQAFRDCFGLGGATEVTQHVIGSPGTAEADETILDLSVMTAVAPQLERLDVFMVAGSPPGPVEDQALDVARMFAAPIEAALTGGPVPDVISASFGLCENAPLFWQGRSALVGITEDILATAAAAGITYVVSTGDSGSSGCEANFRIPEMPIPLQSVQYPGSSAWVTAVGGTNLTLNGDNSIASSGVWNDSRYAAPYGPLPYAGTGGRSALVARPAWQDPLSGLNGAARAVPDVSLFADSLPGYAIFGPDGWEPVGGTSAATPLFAGVLALMGQASEAQGQPTPGFANPLLYELGSTGSDAITDIVLGDNDVFDIGCCSATPGFDLASGWGSPRASTLAATLAPPEVSLSATRDPSAGEVVLQAVVGTSGGSVSSYRWDTDGDGEFDETTSQPQLRIPQVAGVTVAVEVVTTLGRTGAASALVAAPAPDPGAPAHGAPLSIAG